MLEFPEYKTEDIYEGLKNIISEQWISTSLFERIANCVDPLPFEVERDKLPYLVVRPGSVEEVSELMKYANSKRIPVFIRNSGTNLGGVSRYLYKGIVLHTARLRDFKIYQEEGYVEFGPGFAVLEVDTELNKHGYWLPWVPGSRRVASTGGIANNNTSGDIVDAAIGKPLNYILGLQVVLPTGEILDAGTRSLRKPAGTDLTKFFVGSDGQLGVITKIRCRLVPDLKKTQGYAIFKDEESLARAVQNIYYERIPPPLFMEMLDRRCAVIGFELQSLEPPSGAVLMFRQIGITEEEAVVRRDRTIEAIKRGGNPVKAEKTEDLTFWNKIWAARGSISPYISQVNKGRPMTAELVATLGTLLDVLGEAKNIGKDMPTLRELGEPYVFGHIGSMTLHPNYPIPVSWPEEKKAKAQLEFFEKENKINVKYETCGGEWGQFSFRTPFFIERYGEKAYELVKGIKKIFDPNNILNPGVMRE